MSVIVATYRIKINTVTHIQIHTENHAKSNADERSEYSLSLSYTHTHTHKHSTAKSVAWIIFILQEEKQEKSAITKSVILCH